MVNSIPQTEANGYGQVELKFKIIALYPDGGKESAPVKKINTFFSVIL